MILLLLKPKLPFGLSFLLLNLNHYLYVLRSLFLLSPILLKSLLSKVFILLCLCCLLLGSFIGVVFVGLYLLVYVFLHVEMHLCFHGLLLKLLVLSLQFHLLVFHVPSSLHNNVSGALSRLVNLSNRLNVLILICYVLCPLRT